MQAVTLTTDRLELTPPKPDDVEAIYAGCQDPLIARSTPIPSPYLRSHAEEFVERTARGWDEGVNLDWAIRRRDRSSSDPTLVGMIGLYRNDGKGQAELGYWIAPEARRQGYVVEAARAVIDWGFSPEGRDLVRIEWRANTANIGSARAGRALGFRYEGLLRQGLTNGLGKRADGWMAALLRDDGRTPPPWPVLEV